jgi:HSP20 family protein
MMGDVGGRGDASGFATETHVDVYEEDGRIRVVADLPGVDKDGIELKCDGELLTISAASDRREYDERIRLPARVDEHSAAASFNNGVLEVTFDRVDDSAAIDVE